MSPPKGKLFIISAPSGAGKTTILKKVMATLSRLAFSISHTTRMPRPLEKDGTDYHFVSRQEFEEMIGRELFLEFAEVHGNLYGTSRVAVEHQLAKGVDVILDIDVQGAEIVRNSQVVEATHIFVTPPSLIELEKRLRGRATESEDTIKMRLANAKIEMLAAAKYEYLVVNDDLDVAVNLLLSIITAERARAHRHPSGEPITGLI